jgi:hypothetical protein
MIRTEGVLPYLKVVFRHLPGSTKENNQMAQDTWSVIQDLNPEPPEYNSAMLLLFLFVCLLSSSMPNKMCCFEFCYAFKGITK